MSLRTLPLTRNTVRKCQGSAYEAACEACDCINCTTFNPDKAPFCDTAMEHTASLTADGTIETLDIAPGYWRSSRTSREIRECYEADACVGGSEEYCKTGHGGPCKYPGGIAGRM